MIKQLIGKYFPLLPKRKRTPTIIQMEAVECGAASLAIILGYHGRFVPLEELRVSCGVTRDGSNALNLVKAAEIYNLEAKGYKVDIDEINTLLTPFIVFWNFNHFLVVEGFGKEFIYLNDPATGPRTISYDDFDQAYTGVAITFEPGENFIKGGQPLKLWPAIKERIKNVKLPTAYLCMAGILLLFPTLALPAVTQIFYDNVLGGHQLSWQWGVAIALIWIAIVIGCLTAVQQTYLNRLNAKLSIRFSSDFIWHILRLPISFFSQRFGGEIAWRVTLNDSVTSTMTGSLATTVINLLLIVFYALVMVQYDPVIASIGIIAAFINLLSLIIITRSRLDAYARMRQESGKSMGFAIGALQHMEAIKAAGNESDFFSRWAGYYAKSLNAEREINTKDVVITAVPYLLQSLSTAALLGIGAWRIIHGDLTIGMLLALQALLAAFLNPLMQMVNLGSTLQTLKIDIARLNDVLKNKIDRVFTFSKETPQQEDGYKLKGYLELKNITFGYSPLSPPLIDQLNLTLKPGQRVALVGPSGCGKSTIAKMVSGLYEPWSGEILYDGKPIQEIPRNVLHHSIASVDQDIFLFSGRIKDNLTLWDSTIPESEIIQAAKDAQIHDEILKRQENYEAKLTEGGANLSGGQRQRLEIARALVLSPSILIMDEATSALDSTSEELISRNIRRRGCTCVMIAHRLSTIRDCDEILVLDQGKVVQRGTHEELRALPGIYQELIEKEGSFE